MHGRKTTEEVHGCREGHAEGQRKMLRRDGGQPPLKGADRRCFSEEMTITDSIHSDSATKADLLANQRQCLSFFNIRSASRPEQLN